MYRITIASQTSSKLLPKIDSVRVGSSQVRVKKGKYSPTKKGMNTQNQKGRTILGKNVKANSNPPPLPCIEKIN